MSNMSANTNSQLQEVASPQGLRSGYLQRLGHTTWLGKTLCASLTLVAGSALTKQDNLCGGGEVPVFSCRIKTKIASLCATPDISEIAGFLYYRFGTKARVELAFPEPPANPRDEFKWGLMDFTDANGDFVRFKRGDYSYTVYSWAKRASPDQDEGVTVRKHGKLIATLSCDTPALSEGGWGLVYKANLPRDDDREP